MFQKVHVELKNKEQSFAAIFDLFHDRLLLFAQGMLDTKEEAADIVQDAFVALWQRMDNFSDTAAVKVFLYLTVKNKCLNVFKHEEVRRRYHHLSIPLYDEKPVMIKLIEAEVLGEIRRAIARLPKGCRDVISLGYYEGLRNHEIAAHLNVSVNTVKTQKARALRLMRDMLKKQPLHMLFLFGKIF
ncbi:RNA polymerase sigma-70 factor [Chitinophaga solisilvae]|uniref:RNA polymerase sigma-70 factor n=1 Tax=Chitinophaga solisilvae TaxID=1233460 RepID=A0A9Q5D357_9BACT|nr:RNA polymerase sigma-70 factor [Chitinophaga solisilvae]NSL85323.1 RNA polymerase sigma-70 factor [Chitinophaga solisilvae]